MSHGTRHDLFLPSLYPLRHPSRKVESGGELLSSALVPQKVCELKNCLARPLLSVACFSVSLALSGCPVTGCRRVYMKPRLTSSRFLKNFSFFCEKNYKALKNQCFQNCIFRHLLLLTRKLPKKIEKSTLPPLHHSPSHFFTCARIGRYTTFLGAVSNLLVKIGKIELS